LLIWSAGLELFYFSLKKQRKLKYPLPIWY